MALNTDVVDGGNITVGTWNGSSFDAVANATSSGISHTTEMREIKHKALCGNKKFKPTGHTWTANTDGLNSYSGLGFTELLAVKKAGTEVLLTFMPTDCTDNDADFGTGGSAKEDFVVQYGLAYITQLDANYPDDESSTYTASFQGSGELYSGVWSDVQNYDGSTLPVVAA